MGPPVPTTACPSCGLVLPDLDGPLDPYGAASRACWGLFGEVTARDFGEYHYPAANQLIVDAYQAQHAGYSTAAGRRSVAVHLVGLYLALEVHMPPAKVGRTLGRVFPDKRDIAPLLPIPRAALTIAHVHEAKDLGEHQKRGFEWAQAVWCSWSEHHPQVIALAEAALATR